MQILYSEMKKYHGGTINEMLLEKPTPAEMIKYHGKIIYGLFIEV